MSGLTVFRAALRQQAQLLRRSPGDLVSLVITPLYAVIFLAITEHAGRSGLTAYAVVAPPVMALWSMALLVSGNIVDSERSGGTLEALLATPASLTTVISARVCTVTLISLAGVPESWLVARLLFDVTLPVPHPVLFTVVMLSTALATAGTATALSTLFVLARAARAYQNSLNYPLYILGGIIVPVALLPHWLHPLTHVVFLSWSSELLRDCLAEPPVHAVLPRLGAVLGLGAAAYLLGSLGLRRAVDRLRATGAVGQA
ncbi:ABC transporter permease [Streptomyces sp. NBC_00829]|uniref:ABC transporter permease n=1 Tax=Streptomyces sp. NBC_00829 TaxID=2903679 RepID=UPI00386CAF06|nr:ABC transporter permease [Streptomyces sp. NBC_00829]